MQALDRRSARLEADAWEITLRADWASRTPQPNTSRQVLRQLHETLLDMALGGNFNVHGASEEDPRELGVGYELDKLQEQTEGRELTPEEEVKLAALQDAAAVLRGKRPARRKELEPSFSETAAEYIELWSTQSGLKQSNTRQQKEATFRLFADYISDRPLREVRQVDAASFMDALRRFDPHWARSPAAKEMSWKALHREYGHHPKGLADATLNRHVTTLQELWKWGEQRDRCTGRNPFSGMRKRLTPGKNVASYRPWTIDELKVLFSPPPKRTDLAEVMQVALFTAMRLDEIASLTFGQIKEEDGIRFIDVIDAKSPAGIRQVPLHGKLQWLAERKGAAGDRVWPSFNPEGPGKKPGADAGKDFSNFKIGKGFDDRRKVFHSFRKNVTKIMERAGVLENEWAQVLGHERGFTYKRYNADGITMQRKADLIALIDYPGVTFPVPE